MKSIQTTCPVCEYDRAFIFNGNLACSCGYKAAVNPFKKPEPSEPLTTADLKGWLEFVAEFGHLPNTASEPEGKQNSAIVDALKRVVAERDELTALLEPLCTQGETSLQALEELIFNWGTNGGER